MIRWLIALLAVSAFLLFVARNVHFRLEPEVAKPSDRHSIPAGTAEITAPQALPRKSALPSNLMIPVAGVKAGELVDTFTQARAGGARPHDAIDIMAPRGTPVIAVATGRIEKLFFSKHGGNTIYQRSKDGNWIFYYAHLDAYQNGLREGITVQAGEKIATVGSTGNADPSAPHLHFAINAMAPHDAWYAGRAINPYPLLTASPRAQ